MMGHKLRGAEDEELAAATER
uniref:Uncharacterized protein n=1 Tax=Arundo donax TaxID=35708 RepID=A0A0A9EXW9_ARUDO